MYIANLRAAAMAGVAFVAVAAAPAYAQTVSFDVPPGEAGSSVVALGRQAGVEVIAARKFTEGRHTAPVHGAMTIDQAFAALLKGTGLAARQSGPRTYVILRDGAGSDLGSTAVAPPAPVASNDIVVTAQKREQKIQDVPIAISAFSGKTLDAMKIETGGDLLKSIPNVTFSKNNFAGYNFSIRGIGTKAVAASTDPGVAVAFNSSNLIVNRLFEQEFYDIERVEVLRGPQGTLYGRNATAGVVNIISHKADLDKIDGFFKAESGSYLTRRLSGAVNLPIIEDRLAIRAAGAYTKRDGYDVNDYYGNRIDGRDLWSTRLTVSAKPIDRLHLDLIWEHFNENDDRQRAGKQLCHKDDGPAELGGVPLTLDQRADFSQGCKDGSLYDDGAFGTPNGRSLSAYQAYNFLTNQAGVIGLLTGPDGSAVDPYGNIAQSRNLRHFSAVINPTYRALANVFEANATLDLGKVNMVSQTVYDRDILSSTEDYNRYASVPIFDDTSKAITSFGGQQNVSPNGVFVDPQLGPSNLFVASDLVRARARQFSQEIRFQSNDPSSPLQYVIGANYTNFRYNAYYNVYINTLTASAENGEITAFTGCAGKPGVSQPGCIYIDPNPIGVGPGDGHNYFRSINPYRLTSWGAFADVTYALIPRFRDRDSRGLPTVMRADSRWQTDWSLPCRSRFARISTLLL